MNYQSELKVKNGVPCQAYLFTPLLPIAHCLIYLTLTFNFQHFNLSTFNLTFNLEIMKHRSTTSAAIMTCALLLTLGSCRNENIITFRWLLKDALNPEAITRFPDPSYKLVQQALTNRRSIHPDSAGWFGEPRLHTIHQGRRE